MRLQLIAGVVLASVIVLIAWWLFFATEPAPEPELVQEIQPLPKNYWAEGKGTVSLGNHAIPGRVRLGYLVYPDQRVVIPNLVIWIDDLDLVMPFLWWEAAREPLRCTAFRNQQPIQAVLDDGEFVIPAGSKLLGQSYFERRSNGECQGKARRLEPASTAEMHIIHDPDANRFAFDTEFASSYAGHDFTVTVKLEGDFLNRPPVAELQAVGDGVLTSADGCPGTEKGKPPFAPANRPGGLLVTLRSDSYDPDGHWPEGANPKRSRVDLNFEQWARSGPDGLRFLGAGQDIGPVLFDVNKEHQLLLWVTDRHGAESRKFCYFRVVPPV